MSYTQQGTAKCYGNDRIRIPVTNGSGSGDSDGDGSDDGNSGDDSGGGGRVDGNDDVDGSDGSSSQIYLDHPTSFTFQCWIVTLHTVSIPSTAGMYQEI